MEKHNWFITSGKWQSQDPEEQWQGWRGLGLNPGFSHLGAMCLEVFNIQTHLFDDAITLAPSELLWECTEAAMLRGQRGGPGIRVPKAVCSAPWFISPDWARSLYLLSVSPSAAMWVRTSTSQVVVREGWIRDKDVNVLCEWKNVLKTWGLVITIFIWCGIEQEMLFQWTPVGLIRAAGWDPSLCVCLRQKSRIWKALPQPILPTRASGV